MVKTKLVILSCCIILFLSVGCKARKVLTTRIDSTGVTQSSNQVRTVESKVDTGKIVTKKITATKDSSTTFIEATPTPGTKSTINNDGSITGEFTGIKSTNTKKTITNQAESSAQQKGVSSTKQVDSTGTKKQEVNVQKKIKSVDATPKQGAWPWIVVIIVLGLAGLLLWWFFGRPIGSK